MHRPDCTIASAVSPPHAAYYSWPHLHPQLQQSPLHSLAWIDISELFKITKNSQRASDKRTPRYVNNISSYFEVSLRQAQSFTRACMCCSSCRCPCSSNKSAASTTLPLTYRNKKCHWCLNYLRTINAPSIMGQFDTQSFTSQSLPWTPSVPPLQSPSLRPTLAKMRTPYHHLLLVLGRLNGQQESASAASAQPCCTP